MTRFEQEQQHARRSPPQKNTFQGEAMRIDVACALKQSFLESASAFIEDTSWN